MTGLRILVVDDERLAAERLIHLCARIGGIEVVGVAEDGWTALSKAAELRPDGLLLDISMPGLNGVALARQMTSWTARPAIVFVTAHNDFAVDAFTLAATDYLLKPVSIARLEQAFGKMAAHRQTAHARECPFLKELWVPCGREMIRIAVDALDLIEAERDYVRLHAGTASYLVRMAISDLATQLDPERFVRVHRSTLVAVDRITTVKADAVDGWTVLLSTGQCVRVSRSFRSTVRRLTAGLKAGSVV